MVAQKPKGTTDFYPEEQAIKRELFTRFSTVASHYGFFEVDSPAFEEIKLLTEKEGEEIKQQIFILEKRGEEQFGLRFDLTVPLARMFISIQKSVQKPVKWSYCTNMWRYERPQKGRLREFYQMGLESFGSSRLEADAEIISIIVDSLVSFGLAEEDFVVYINNRKLVQGLLLDYIDETKIDELIHWIDKKEKLSEKEFEDGLKEVGILKTTELIHLLETHSLLELEHHCHTLLAKEGFAELNGLWDSLTYSNIHVSLSTVRGLSYYTGTVFEVFDRDKKYRALAGGGRYDTMIELFGGQKTAATGMGMGLSTVQVLLTEKGKLPSVNIRPEYYVVTVDAESKKQVVPMIKRLRQNYSVETDLVGRDIRKQLEYASTIGAVTAIIVGPEDLKEGMVTVRDMVSGKQEQKRIDDVGK